MLIDVTQEDIDKGKPGMCNCPVARAVKRTTKRRSGVMVYPYNIHIGEDVYESPIEIIRFIQAYDYNGFVEPQTFDLLCAK